MTRRSSPRVRGGSASAPSRSRSSGGLVASFLDRRAQIRIVEARAADGHELPVEVDVDRLDARHLLQLRADRVLAMGAAHPGDAVRDLGHHLLLFVYPD